MWTMLLAAVGDANKAESAARISAAESKTAAKVAEMNAKSTSLALEQKYNNQMASDAVIAASQNRRGGSVAAIRSSAADALDWDLEYTRLGGDLAYMNRMAEASSYKTAGQVGKSSGYASAAMSLYDSYSKKKQIG